MDACVLDAASNWITVTWVAQRTSWTSPTRSVQENDSASCPYRIHIWPTRNRAPTTWNRTSKLRICASKVCSQDSNKQKKSHHKPCSGTFHSRFIDSQLMWKTKVKLHSFCRRFSFLVPVQTCVLRARSLQFHFLFARVTMLPLNWHFTRSPVVLSTFLQNLRKKIVSFFHNVQSTQTYWDLSSKKENLCDKNSRKLQNSNQRILTCVVEKNQTSSRNHTHEYFKKGVKNKQTFCKLRFRSSALRQCSRRSLPWSFSLRFAERFGY